MRDDTILTAHDGSRDTITYGELRRYLSFWTRVLVISAALSLAASTAAMLLF